MGKARKEIRENEYLICDDISPISKRFGYCLKWYIKNACYYKNMYYILTLISTICPIVVAVLNGLTFEEGMEAYIKYAVIVLSAAASISVAVLTIYRAQEKWTRYRAAAEDLKRERVIYLNEKILRKDDPDLDREFLSKIEDYIAKENQDWKDSNQGNRQRNHSCAADNNDNFRQNNGNFRQYQKEEQEKEQEEAQEKEQKKDTAADKAGETQE